LRRRKDRLTGANVSVERSTSRRRSSITEHSCHGINASRLNTKRRRHGLLIATKDFTRIANHCPLKLWTA
jgi:hypothetical protein